MERRDIASTLSRATEAELNPYSRSVQPALFIGREDLLRYFPDRLRPGTCRVILVQGPRRIGKTALLKQVAHQLLEPFIPVYFDLDGRSAQPLPLLVRDLADAVLTALGVTPPVRRHLEDVGQAHRMLLQSFQASAGRRIVLLFDELDVPTVPLTSDASGLRLYPYLQELASLEAGPSLVLARGRTRDALNTTAGLSYFEAAPIKRLTVLTLQEARELLVAPSTGRVEFQRREFPSCALQEEAVQCAFKLTHRHPYLLKLLASELFDLPRRSSPAPLGVLEVMSCVPRVLEAGNAGLEWMWKGLTTQEQQITAAIALSGPLERPVSISELSDFLQLHTTVMSEAEIRESLGGLELNEFIRREGSSKVSFNSELLLRWVALRHPLPLFQMGTADSLEAATAGAPAHSTAARAAGGEERPPLDTVEDLWFAAEALQSSRVFPLENVTADHSGSRFTPVPSFISPLRQEVAPELPMPRSDQDAQEASALSMCDRLLKLGQDACVRGEYDTAVAAFRQVVELESSHVEAAFELARALTENLQFKEAIEALQRTAPLSPAATRELMGEVYLRWLDEVSQDDNTWAQVIERGLKHLPDHTELRRRQHGARILRVKRLLTNGRPVESAAALGGLGPELTDSLPEVLLPLLDSLEALTRRHHPDAQPLFSILRRLLPEPRYAWLRYLGPLIDEAERNERHYPDRAEELYRNADSAILSAGADSNAAPEALRERLEAGRKRLTISRQRADETQLAGHMKAGDLDRAEEWLEDLLVKRRSPHLEEHLRKLRRQRQLNGRYQFALAARDRQAYAEAQGLLAQVLSEAPHFKGPDGCFALDRLDELSALKLGQNAKVHRSPDRLSRRRTAAAMASTFLVGALMSGASVSMWQGRWSTQPDGEVITSALQSRPPIASVTPASPLQAVVSVLPPAPVSLVAEDASEPGIGDKLPSGEFPVPAAPSTALEASAKPDTVTLPVGRNPGTAPEGQVLPAPVPSRSQAQGLTSSGPSFPPSSRLPHGPGPGRVPATGESLGRAPTLSRATTLEPSKEPLPSRLEGTDRTPTAVPVTVPATATANRAVARPTIETAAAVPAIAGSGTIAVASIPRSGTSAAPGLPPLDDYQAGVAAMRSGRLDEALASFRRAIAQQPQRADIYLALGDLYLRQGRSMDALRTYQRAVTLDPRLIPAHYALGKLHQTQGHREDAIAAFQAVVRLDAAGSLSPDAHARLKRLQSTASVSPAATWKDGDSVQGQAPVQLFLQEQAAPAR